MTTIPRQIVVPIDVSQDDTKAVEVGVEWAGDASRVYVLHVLADYTAGEPGLLRNVLDEATRRDHVLETMRRKLERPELADVRLAVSFGDPGERIVEFARDVRADLIVIASHGRRGVSRLLLGSVAERVVRLAACPVLVLKPDTE
jgi:nucleotide-binding universal stress UspA family protein